MRKFCLVYMALALLLSWGLAGANTNPGAFSSDPIITDQGGPDAYGYRWIDNDSAGGPAYNWIDITTRGVQVTGLADDNNVGPIQMGFQFPYYWYTVSQMWIGSNGYISFSSNANFAHPFADIPANANPNDLIAILAGDLDFTRGGSCYYFTNNADSFIVSWINVPPFDANGQYGDSIHTFQLILASSDSSLTFQYGDNHGNFSESGNLADVIGMENVNGQVGIQYLRNNLPASHMWHEGLTIKFHPTPDPSFVVHDFGIVDGFHSGSGADFVPSGSPYTLNVLVKNFGNQVEASLRTSLIIKRSTTTVWHDTLTVEQMNPGEERWIQYPDPFQQDSVFSYRATFASLMSGDQNSNNNTRVCELDVYRMPGQFKYVDDIAETGRSWNGDFSGFANEFVIGEPVLLDSAYFNVYAVTANGDAYVWVVGSDINGNPDLDNILAQDTVQVTATGWYAVDFTWANLNFAANSKFWVVALHALQNTFSIGMDQTVPLSNRGWEYTGGLAGDRDRGVSDVMIKIKAEAGSGPVFGHIAGDVTDGTNPLAGVIVETFDAGNALVATDTTDAGGLYNVDLLPGTYHENFTKAGYQPQTVNDIIVVGDQTTAVHVVMSVTSGCQYRIGDINNNGQTNGIDVTYGVGFFKGGAVPPVDCFPACPNQPNPFYAAGDVNGNCAFNGIDVTYFVSFLKGGAALRNCPDCPPAR